MLSGREITEPALCGVETLDAVVEFECSELEVEVDDSDTDAAVA
jgi:hypothetical protein